MSFDAAMYDLIRAGCQESAAVVAPIVHDLVRPKWVIDVGGGEGWWASAFHGLGAYAVATDIEQPASVAPGVEFHQVDAPHLLDPEPDPGGARYDLAVCLEVAEHLPPEQAPALVAALCKLAPVVLWSAAIPGQGGHGHLNEQWPGYWADLFYAHGLVCTERLRDEFWDYDDVEPWYRQNLLLFARHEWFDLQRMEFTKHPRAVVHPVIYGWRLAELGRDPGGAA
jgi:SAM-dependent methyltransferase